MEEEIYLFLETDDEFVFNIDNLKTGSLYAVELSNGCDESFEVFEASDTKFSLTINKHDICVIKEYYVDIYRLIKHPGKWVFEKEWVTSTGRGLRET